MSNFIQKWQALENNRLQLIQELSHLDTTILNKKPNPEKWSALQNIVHLIQAEKQSFAYIQKKLSYQGDLPPSGFKSKMRLMALKLVFSLPFKYKAPAAVGENLPEISDLTTLNMEWSNLRSELLTFLKSLPESTFEKEVWKHPFAGKLSLLQMLDFFGAHIDRHREQIKTTIQMVTAS